MTEYNKDTAARLVAEAREDDERMTPGPWTTDVLVDTADHEVIAPGHRCWTPGGYDIGEDKPVAAGIARTRNNLRALADQLEAAGAEVERLKSMAWASFCECIAAQRDEARNDRDRLAAHLARLSLTPAEVEALRWIRVMLREDDDVQQRYGWKQDYRVAGEILDRLLAAAQERKP